MENKEHVGKKCRRKGKAIAKAPRQPTTRRPWSEEEDTLLMNLLEQLVTQGWKTENGFKPGYQKQLQKMILKINPETDIRASPHINSKITQWKRAYGSIRAMLHLSSGIGFNTTTNVIDCDGEQWEKAVLRDPNLANMRFKPFPFYKKWIELFGDDKATGKTAQDLYTMYSKIVEEDKDEMSDDDDDEDDSFDEEVNPSGSSQFGGDAAMESDSQTPRSNATRAAPSLAPSTTPSRSRKRTASTLTTNSDIDSLTEVLNRLVSSSDERLGTLCDVMRYDFDKGKLRQDIFNMLEDMPQLTSTQKINVSWILVKHSECMEMFLGFPPHARREYVEGLLSGEFDESKRWLLVLLFVLSGLTNIFNSSTSLNYVVY